MKITLEAIPQSTIEDFANKHNLKLTVYEREQPIGSADRYYACFDNCDIKDGHMLIREFGNGVTPESAVDTYAEEIQFKTIVIDAYGDSRREIKVPRLIK